MTKTPRKDGATEADALVTTRLTPTQRQFRRFLRHKLAVVSAIVLVLLGIVAIGAIGKGSAWLLMLIYWLNGTIGFWAFAAFALDLIFAILFTRFLLRFAAR